MSGENPGQERGVSPVASKQKARITRKHGAIAVLVLCAVIIGMTLWRSQNPQEPEVKEKLPPSLGAVVPYKSVMVTAPPPPPQPAPAPQPPPAPRFEPASGGLPQPNPGNLLARLQAEKPPETRQPPAANIVPPAPIKPNMLSFAERPRAPQAQPGSPAGVGGLGEGGIAGSSGPTTSPIGYKVSRLEGNKADLLGDQTFLLMPGIIPCTLDTAINSSFEGPILCHLPLRVMPHGVVLLGRGARVHGWYKNNIQTGQARLFVQADWVEDPATGCFIKFDVAPMSDTLGRTGIEGNVDNHYIERFGAAMLLTFTQSALSLAQAALTKQGGGNTYLSFGGGGGGGGGIQTIATEILRAQINIPPTITVNEGTDIAIFVTRPLDFGPCYDVQIKDR